MHFHLLFLEWNKSPRVEYFMTAKLDDDHSYLTEDTYDSLKLFSDRIQGTYMSLNYCRNVQGHIVR